MEDNINYGYIYKATNLINGKIYIGQHRKPSFDKKYLGSGKHLKYAIKKYGKNNFKCEILEYCSSLEELNSREIYYIKENKSQDRNIGYNITNGGNQISVTPSIAKKLSEKQKQNFNDPIKGEKLRLILSKANKGKKLSEEHINKLKEVNHNRVRTKEERDKKSKSLKGHKPFWGDKMPEHIKEKISNSSKGRHWYNNGVCEKFCIECPNGFKNGRLPFSENTKQKISDSNKGKNFSTEIRQKISKSKLGKNNPQYGKIGTNKGKVKVYNSETDCIKYIYPDELEFYIYLGFKKNKFKEEI